MTWVQADPPAMYSMPSVAPAGEEPSAKRSTPETAVGRAPFWLAARTVIAETGCENCAARVRRAGSWAYSDSPGQDVWQPSRWPLTRSKNTCVPARIAVALAAAGGQRDLAQDRDAVQRELPADQARERLHGRRVERHVRERPETRDAGRVAVPALRLGADHGGLDATRAALEDDAVAVDEEVVTDVVPAVGVAVVARDAEDDAGRLLRRVVDRGDRVVHERGLHHAVARWVARRDLVGAPGGTRDDRGCAGLRRAGAGGGSVGEGADEACLEAAGGAAQAQLELVRGAGEDRVAVDRRRPRGWRAAASSASSVRSPCARGPGPSAASRAPSAGR